MSNLSISAIYILTLTLIGGYYYARYCLPFIVLTIMAVIVSPYEIPKDFIIRSYKYFKRMKRIVKAATPTQFTIRVIISLWKGFWLNIFSIIIYFIFYLIIILLHLLFYWIFFVDHSSWISYLIFGYVIWFFIRGAIVISILAIAISHFKKFPKIKYFKDLRHMFAMGFGYIYLAVALYTFGEVLRLAALGHITTPFFSYYVQWFHLFIGQNKLIFLSLSLTILFILCLVVLDGFWKLNKSLAVKK